MFLMARKSRSKKRSKKKSRKSRKKSAPQIHISRDAQLDILGYGMLAVALLTFLALLSAQRGVLLGPWVRLLSGLFGWGVYLVPFFIGAVGFYLVFRRFGDRIPRPDPEQVVGILLLFVCFLITAHFVALWATALPVQGIVGAGYGGGQTGAWLAQLLVLGLGKAGTALVVLVAWLLGIAFTFSISPADMLEGLLAAGRKARPAGKTRRTSPPATAAPQPKINGAPAPARPSTPAPATPAPEPSRAAPKVKTTGKKKPEPHPIPDYAYPQQLIGDSMLQLPTLDAILEPGDEQHLDQGFLRQQSRIIEETLASLGTPVAVKEINRGPVVTQFGVEPLVVTNSRGQETRVKVSKISSLADDLALALSAKSIRIQTPIPGKGLVGIEVPNHEISLVALRDIIESEQWMESRSRLRLGMGQDVSGQPVVADLADMPHLLIAGTTGSGKSVCINSILAALLLQNTPQDLKLLMVDPKRVELTQYNGIPHLLAPVVVEMERVVGALKWVLREMDGRYRRFAEAGAREITDYNERIAAEDPEAKKMPYIVVVVDELADLMMLAPQETERAICRLAQMARATGIHLIIATQRPSVDVVTGLIKANFPARIAFAVASSVDSRVILDIPGAERLLGRGDMLFMPPDVAEPVRLQGAFVSDEELRRLVRYWKGGRELEAPTTTTLATPPPSEATQLPLQEKLAPLIEFEDDLLPDAIEVLLAEDRASISLLQRRLRIGYTRSARIVDLLEEMKIIGPPQSGGQTRDVYRDAAEELLRQAGKLM
jgi:S-DNA-T family DNA segregation ATPase FtsK/SpoIIIE